MRYRVTFLERTGGDGNPSEFPPDYVDIDVPDGVVVDKAFVERAEPTAIHNTESLEEDDSFLSIGSETWDYDIADGREDEFLAALKNSQMAFECVELNGGESDSLAPDESSA
jgi:hypothetical protein